MKEEALLGQIKIESLFYIYDTKYYMKTNMIGVVYFDCSLFEAVCVNYITEIIITGLLTFTKPLLKVFKEKYNG